MLYSWVAIAKNEKNVNEISLINIHQTTAKLLNGAQPTVGDSSQFKTENIACHISLKLFQLKNKQYPTVLYPIFYESV